MIVFLSILESVCLLAQLGQACSSAPLLGEEDSVLRMDGVGSPDFPSEPGDLGRQAAGRVGLIGSVDLGGASRPSLLSHPRFVKPSSHQRVLHDLG